MGKIKILVADDHPLVAEGLSRILKKEKSFTCVATVSDGVEAVKLTQSLKPDVVVLDAAMPRVDGIEATKQIKSACPQTSVLVISAYDDRPYQVAAIKAGADGYLTKGIPHGDLIRAIHLVHDGTFVLNPRSSHQVLYGLVADEDNNREMNNLRRLHNRELEVLRLAANGMSNKQIAAKLGISESTVGTHLCNTYRKLGVNSRTEAVSHALRKGLVTLGEVATGPEDSQTGAGRQAGL